MVLQDTYKKTFPLHGKVLLKQATPSKKTYTVTMCKPKKFKFLRTYYFVLCVVYLSGHTQGKFHVNIYTGTVRLILP